MGIDQPVEVSIFSSCHFEFDSSFQKFLSFTVYAIGRGVQSFNKHCQNIVITEKKKLENQEYDDYYEKKLHFFYFKIYIKHLALCICSLLMKLINFNAHYFFTWQCLPKDRNF